MGLDVPDLDERTYESLLEDARKRIPVYDEQWTDHNAHDPGITVLELLAWLVESYGYQADRVTDAHRQKYLELLGVSPRPPIPATVDLLAAADGIDGTGVEIEAGTVLVAETPDGEDVEFRTTASVAVTGAALVDVVVDPSSGSPIDRATENGREDVSFRPFGPEAGPGDDLYLGFDADPFDGSDRLELVVDFHDDDLPAPTDGRDPKLRALAEAVATAPPELTEPLERHVDRLGDGTAGFGEWSTDEDAFDPSIGVRWSLCTDPAEWYTEDGWVDLTVSRDETTHFYQGGRVVLEAPTGHSAGEGRILDRDPERYWIRCACERRREAAARDESDTSGTRSDDEGDERYELVPRVDAIRTNVIPAVHWESSTAVRLEGASEDRTTVEPNQQFRFPQRPVLAATVFVGEEEWTRVDDFTASGPDDEHVVLEPSEGEVRFGDGRRGAVPPVDRAVVARSVVYGGGRRGNVPSNSRWRFGPDLDEQIRVDALEAPSTGREAEPIPDAFVRTNDERSVPQRAVTAEDVRELAVRTPGVRVGRAAAIVDAGEESTGSREITVVVVPHSRSARTPVPTRGVLSAVERHLRSRTLLTDCVSVVAPNYVPVDVTATVRVADDVSASERRDAARERLETFFHPLDGFDGDGWPFGRGVHRSNVYEVLAGVSGIDVVEDVSIRVGGDTEPGADERTLPYPGSIVVDATDDSRSCGGGF